MPQSQRPFPAPHRLAALVAFAAALLLSPAVAHADDDKSNLRLHIKGEDGGKLDLDLSLGWLASLVDWADIECDTQTDRQTRRMAQSLDRQGEGGVYEFENQDGDDVVARRVKSTLRIESREEHGELSTVEMPWPLAECLFLGREPRGGLAKALADGNFKVRIESSDGSKISVDVD